MLYNVQVQRYWRNYLLCWHGQHNRRLFKSNNGVVSFCGICGRKRLGIHDFGTLRYE
jgi:hypothetical protein